jgi:hypothetical protein
MSDRDDRLQGMELPAALYEPTDDGWLATALTIGPRDPGLQHAGPPAALLLREAERASGIEGGQTVRPAVDVFAPVPVGPVHVRSSVVRPGRRIELVEAVLTAASGVSAELDWTSATFANVDLTLSLHRPPPGGLAGPGRGHSARRHRRRSVLRRPLRR